MKIFKKAISLVLVFAMLASFAGMTGYSPASIIAEAIDYQTWEFDDGFSLKLPTKVYKMTKSASGYGMLYRNTSGVTNTAIPDNYYGLPMDYPANDLSFTIVCPEGGDWRINCSLDKATWPAGFTKTDAKAGNNWTRGESSSMNDEYGVLFRSLNNDSNMGFRDINKVYWRLTYTLNGVTKYGYAEVDVVFPPSSPSNKTTSVTPLDSKNGINHPENVATIDCPTVFYTDGQYIQSSASGTPLDTDIDIDLPDNTTSATISCINFADDTVISGLQIDVIESNGNINFAGWDATALDGNTPNKIYMRLDYTVTNVAHTPYSNETGNVIDTSYDERGSLTTAYIDDEYDVALPDTVEEVTYTQYLAVYHTPLPAHKMAEVMEVSGRQGVGNRGQAGFYQGFDLSKLLAISGVNLFTTVVGTADASGQGGAIVGDNYLAKNGDGTINYNPYADGGWTNNYKKNDDTSYLTTGSNIIYNSASGSTISGPGHDKYTATLYNWPNNGDSDHWYISYKDGKGGGQTGYASANATIYIDSQKNFGSSGISVPVTTVWSNYNANINGCNINTGASYYTVRKLTQELSSSYTWSGYWADGSDDYPGKAGNPTTPSVSKDLYFGTGAASSEYTSDYTGWSDGAYKKTTLTITNSSKPAVGSTNYYCLMSRPQLEQGNTYCLYLPYTFYIHSVDREKHHRAINAAKTNNYVKAEMDATWWEEYRKEVLLSYIGCGDLQDSTGVTSGELTGGTNNYWADGIESENPKYKIANLDEFEAAVTRAPAYDRGTSQRDQVNLLNLWPMGSKFLDVVSYTTQVENGATLIMPENDPANGATYYNNDTGGNGVTTNDNPSIYRYNGAYFYTDDTWYDYARERYYAVNILNYNPNSTTPYSAFWYGAGGLAQNGLIFTELYYQDTINAVTDRLNTAYNNLELRTLADFKMRNDKSPTKDYDGDGTEDNVTTGGGAWVYDSTGKQVIGFDAIMAYLASLIPTDTYTYYTTVSDANGNGKIDALDLDEDGYIDDLNPRTAQVYDTNLLEIQLSVMQDQFHEDDTVVAQGLRFEEAIENFLALVEITLRNPQDANNDAWTQIFTYLNGTSVAGNLRPSAGLKAVNFVDEVTKIYTLTTAERNNFQSLIDTYNTAAAPDPITYVTTRNALSQGSINTAIGNFFVALQAAFPSIKVVEGGTQANNIAKDPTAVFEIYAPNQSANITQSIYTADSIAALEAAVNAELGTNSYQFSTTTWQSLVDRYDTIVNWATVHNATTNPDGKLVSSKVNTDRMDIALQNAQNALAADKTSISVTSPDGKTTVAHGKYTPKSVAELEFVIDQAQNIDRNQLYTNQLAVDMITFALWDECDDTKGLLLTSDTALAPRTWSYDASGNPTGYTDNWGSVIMKSFLYGERVEEGNGTDEGLKPNTAYYGFLEAEIKGNTIIKTVTNEETGETTTTVDDTYIGTVWTANGDLILSDNGTPVGDRIFKNWSSYMEHYNNAVALVNAKDKTVNEQESVVDDAAKKLYVARNALELMNLYFPNNTQDFETAKGWYNELAAFVQKTDVTRYGWEYVDVTEEVTDETTGEVTTVTTTVFQKSENPLSSVVQSVYIYNGVDAAVEAQIESFRAKYASENSTEDYNSLEAAQTLYNNIKAALTDPATGELYTVKKTNDETLIAGMLDLTGRVEVDPETQEPVLVGGYIAGTWTVTFDEETGASTGTYATDLLNDTQAGLLQTYLTNAQNKINSKTDATAGFGTALGGLTSIVFDETKKPATDLKFATHMRDNELFAFLDYKYTNDPELGTGAQLVNYYYQDGMYTYRLIKESIANEIKGQVNGYFAVAENWPKIYEVHGTTWNKEAATVPDGMTDAVVDGYLDYDMDTLESWGEYKGDNEKICEILDLVASRSYYYYDALTRGIMPFEVAHYTWLVNNAVTNIDGIDYVLADASAVSAATEAPFNYDVSVNNTNIATGNLGWYTAGYGVKDVADGKYYLYYNDTEGVTTPSWFTEDSRLKLETALDLSEFANYGINDLDEEGNVVSFSSLDKLAVYTPATYFFTTYGVNLTDIATIPEAGKYPHELYGYYSGYNDIKMQIDSSLITVQQGAIDTIANNAYSKLHDLQLLPATEAYRDVYNTYLSVMGQHIADGNWNGDSYSTATQTDNVDFTFYNVSQASKIEGMYSTLNNNAVPPYGIVSREQYDGFLGKYTQADEYADQTNNPWYNMEQFIRDFIGGGATIYIDQAEKVNLYDKSDNITSIKETLIDEYLSKLEFDDLVYDRLNAVVAAFLGDNLSKGLAEIKGTLQTMGFTVGGNYNGEFYSLNYYTDESLLEVAGILRSTNVLAENKIVEQEIGKNTYKWIGDTFPLPIVYDNSYKGTFYTTTTDQNKIDGSREEDNSVLKAFLNALNTQLVLRGVNIDGLVKEIARGEAVVPEKYDQTHTAWGEYIDALDDAKDLRDDAGNYDIRFQESVIDAMESRLAAAINALEEAILADNYAPSMTLKTSVADVEEFYGNEAYEVALRQADAASFTATGEGDNVTYTANPAAGTFFVPNSSGYSLIVYTNELNPRIVINLEDLEQNLAGPDSTAVWQDAAKLEYISINAKKTSGVTANVIAGTIVPANNGVAERMTVDKAAAATATEAVMATNNSEVKGSSAFAILAPTFVSGKATQAAVYTIEARDGSERNINGGTVYGNPVNQFDFGGVGQEPVDIKVLDSNNKIAIYVYYYSLKAADGKDEGISADGTALATPAIEGTHVPSALLSGEPGFKGQEWRNGVLLQRHFSDSHRVWEYVSEIKQNEQKQYSVNGTQVPVYNDPTFGYLNTGSFYYVLNEKVAADAEVIEVYDSGNNAVAGCMDYDRATAAKTAMIDAINAMDETELNKMKESGRFYNYGDYETDEFGNVLYNGDEAKWINWAQAIGNKVENGDLVFVHVVDRWGNVVNRIIEVTNFDKKAPQVNSAASGAVSINEAGGSGIKDITVHNGDFSLGKFDYEINQSQKLTNGQVANNATVESADNTLTIKGLVPGKLYYIGAYDNAGNAGSTPVNASVEGKITLTITVEDDRVETGEEGSVASNSTTFTLNGIDTIILNSGEASSVIDASLEGNVFANRTIRHYITTKDNVTALKTVYQDGTVEEFTAETATVKDNGDGTLTWTIKRKLAEGEHKYKVYAKVNGGYENFYAPATINATTRTVKIECTNVGQGVTQLNFSGSLSFDIANYISKEVPYGTQVTISAKAYTTYEGCEFYYWINNTTDRIISTADVYEFKAVTNADYIAQFTNNSTCIDGKKFVVYVNNAKNVIERFELADGDSYTVPTGPVLPDYTFKGWSMTKAEVLASDKDTIIVEPIYELNASNTVTITEGNYTATGAGTYTAEANQRAVVTISTSAKNGDGKEFLYWIDADTDEIVSYDRTYSFFCVKNTVLTPVYGDASAVQAEPIVRITEVKYNALSGKVSFFAERSVPEEFMILQTGIVVTKTESIGTNEEVFVVGGTSTAAGTSTSTANNGYYSANTVVATGQTVWARAYVIYETADGEIFEAYGPVVSYTVD
ncbi:MAG: hypothetical protein IKK09_02700 [Clostridia bacterium]|nr:hypothetical protein [Clostridia bacterium]